MRNALRRWLMPELTAELTALERRVQTLKLEAQSAKRTLREASGVPITWGEFDYELNEAFRGRDKWVTLAKMTSDPHVKGALRVNTLPLVNAKWEIKPASEDERDLEIADFVSAVLLRKPTEKYGREYWTETSWTAQRLPEILSMLEYGFAMFAKSWRPVGGKHVLDRLTWLEPSSVDPHGWRVDEKTDEFLGVFRTYNSPGGMPQLQDPIEAEDLALYVWDMKGARFEGTPFIRAMYGPWYRKDFVQRMATIWAQKVGAPPPIGAYPQSWSDEEITRFKTFVRELRGTAPSHAFFVGPKGSDGEAADVSYAGSETGEIDRSRSVIEMENQEIAHVGGTKHMLLGETARGARAVADSQQKLEMLQVRAIGEIICEWETHGIGNMPGLIEELVDRNFRGVQAYPCLTVSNVSPGEQLETLDGLIAAKTAGLIPDHPDLRRQVTERLGYVLPDEAYEIEPAEMLQPPGPNGKPQPEPEEDPEDDPQEDRGALTTTDTATLGLLDPVGSAGSRRRPLTRLEAEYVNLGAVEEAFRVGQVDCEIALKSALRMVKDEIKKRVADGKISRRSIDTQRRSRFRGMGRAMAELLPPMVATGEQGVQHVADELERQHRRQAGLASAAPDPRKGEPARKVVAGRVLLRESVEVFGDEIRLFAEMSIGEIWDRVMRETLAEYVRLTREGLEGEALVAAMDRFIDSLSDKPVSDQARKASSVAYNQGRDMALETARSVDAATFAIRTGILDRVICDPCLDVDAHVVEIGTDEYYALMPPAKCLGKERCRCIYVGVSKDLSQDANWRTQTWLPEDIEKRFPFIDVER